MTLIVTVKHGRWVDTFKIIKRNQYLYRNKQHLILSSNTYSAGRTRVQHHHQSATPTSSKKVFAKHEGDKSVSPLPNRVKLGLLFHFFLSQKYDMTSMSMSNSTFDFANTCTFKSRSAKFIIKQSNKQYLALNLKYIPYARHHRPLLIRSRS